MPTLRCPSVLFYSPEDESSFFAWASKVPGIRRVTGEGRDIVLTLGTRTPSEDTLRELIGLFHRYKVPMKHLAAFERPSNTAWFRNTSAYWYRKVFTE